MEVFVDVGMARRYPPDARLTPAAWPVAAFRGPDTLGKQALAPPFSQEVTVLVLGIILMLLGFLLAVPVLWTIGIILAVVGAVLWVADGAGAHWGRRWY